MALPPDVVELASERLVATPKQQILLNEAGVASAMAAVCERFPDHPPDIICIDPIRNVFDGGPDSKGENDNSAMLFFLQKRVELLRDRVNPEAGVILCHHTKKIPKQTVVDDPFQALSGAGSLRSFYTSGMIMHRPDEARPERRLFFELRNGPALEPMMVDKIAGRWVALSAHGERLVRQNIGQKLDAERRRKRDVILQLLFDEAADGRAYTAAQFAEQFENQSGLGGRDTIGQRIAVLATKGCFRNSERCRLQLADATTFEVRLSLRRGHAPRPGIERVDPETGEVVATGMVVLPSHSSVHSPAPCCPSRPPRGGATPRTMSHEKLHSWKTQNFRSGPGRIRSEKSPTRKTIVISMLSPTSQNSGRRIVDAPPTSSISAVDQIVSLDLEAHCNHGRKLSLGIGRGLCPRPSRGIEIRAADPCAGGGWRRETTGALIVARRGV